MQENQRMYERERDLTKKKSSFKRNCSFFLCNLHIHLLKCNFTKKME